MNGLVTEITDFDTFKLKSLKAIDRPKIGWISIYTPEEIIYAAGLIPCRITGKTGTNIAEAGGYLGSNYCSYLLSCLSEGLNNVYDFTDGVIFVDSCDMRKRLYEVWDYNVKPDYNFLLELPKDTNVIFREYFRTQLHHLIKSLENHFECEITKKSLKEAISVYNKSRELMQELYNLRKDKNCHISGVKAINIVEASMSSLKEDFNDKLAMYLGEVKAKKNVKKEKENRVLICGSYFNNSNIINIIEDFGAKVVCEDISNGIKYIEGQINQNIDPVDAIADYYLDKVTSARMIDTDRRINHLLKLIKEYNVDSIIYYSLKFCDTNFIDFPYVKNKLNQLGIPVLLIEGEYHTSNIENIKTRIQTFFETKMVKGS